MAAGITLLLAGAFALLAGAGRGHPTARPTAAHPASSPQAPRDPTVQARQRPVRQQAAAPTLIQKLKPLHGPLAPPGPSDWRSGPGKDERGQSYAQWLRSDPIQAHGARRKIYTQWIGAFDGAPQEIVERTTEFLGIYFGLPIRNLEMEPVDEEWPRFSRRPGRGFGDQLLSTYILQNLLGPVLQKDAAVLVGLTYWDLFPDPDWNFVFGQATLHKRVGVWSIRRFGDPAESRSAWIECLRRACKLASHETGHIFSIDHCTAYACNMNGSNSLRETDAHPLALCPECLAKIVTATGVDPAERFASLIRFCEQHGLAAEAAFYKRSLKALKGEAKDE